MRLSPLVDALKHVISTLTLKKSCICIKAFIDYRYTKVEY